MLVLRSFEAAPFGCHARLAIPWFPPAGLLLVRGGHGTGKTLLGRFLHATLGGDPDLLASLRPPAISRLSVELGLEIGADVMVLTRSVEPDGTVSSTLRARGRDTVHGAAAVHDELSARLGGDPSAVGAAAFVTVAGSSGPGWAGITRDSGTRDPAGAIRGWVERAWLVGTARELAACRQSAGRDLETLRSRQRALEAVRAHLAGAVRDLEALGRMVDVREEDLARELRDQLRLEPAPRDQDYVPPRGTAEQLTFTEDRVARCDAAVETVRRRRRLLLAGVFACGLGAAAGSVGRGPGNPSWLASLPGPGPWSIPGLGLLVAVGALGRTLEREGRERDRWQTSRHILEEELAALRRARESCLAMERAPAPERISLAGETGSSRIGTFARDIAFRLGEILAPGPSIADRTGAVEEDLDRLREEIGRREARMAAAAALEALVEGRIGDPEAGARPGNHGEGAGGGPTPLAPRSLEEISSTLPDLLAGCHHVTGGRLRRDPVSPTGGRGGGAGAAPLGDVPRELDGLIRELASRPGPDLVEARRRLDLILERYGPWIDRLPGESPALRACLDRLIERRRAIGGSPDGAGGDGPGRITGEGPARYVPAGLVRRATGLARLLIGEPGAGGPAGFCFLDEPLADLDPAWSGALLSLLAEGPGAPGQVIVTVREAGFEPWARGWLALDAIDPAGEVRFQQGGDGEDGRAAALPGPPVEGRSR